MSTNVTSKLRMEPVESTKQRTDHDRCAEQDMQMMKKQLVLDTASHVAIANMLETEVRKPADASGLSLAIEKIIETKYFYFAANVNQHSNAKELSYESARKLLKQINFDRKRPKPAGRTKTSNTSANETDVDQQCRERHTAIHRWRSFVDSSFWNGSRPRDLARMLAAGGLFLLSRYDQFAVKLSERSRNELPDKVPDKVPANYELLPAPKRLKVRCSFCKRVFEVPYHSSFSYVDGQFNGSSSKNDYDSAEQCSVSASHFSADSHYATVCAIANYIKQQHERKSPSCPAVVGVRSDDVRFSETTETEQTSVALQIRTDPFYHLAEAKCQVDLAAKTDGENVTRSFNSHPVEDESSLSESPVTKEIDEELFCSYKRIPAGAYSDAIVLCPDDNAQFGSWREYELSGSARLGDPTEVYDEKCQPIEPDRPVTRIIYDDFPPEVLCDIDHPSDDLLSTRVKLDNDNLKLNHISGSFNSSGYFTDSHNKQNRSELENVALNAKKSCFLVSRCDDEVQFGYESLFEQVVHQEPLYAPFRSADLRLETFEAEAQISTSRLSLRAYIAICVHETNMNTKETRLDEKCDQIDSLRMRFGDSDWPHDRRRLFERLTEAGFFSLRRQESDVCVCFWCGIAISGWHEKADAYVEHARHLRDGESCAYLFYQRGAQFIIDARNHYLSDMARTERVDLLEFTELPDTPADYSLLKRLQVSVRKPSGTALLHVKVQKSKPVASQPAEIPYDPVISFRTTGVSYRVEEREVRARKDLRLVRNLIFVCGAQPIAVSFAMERRLKTTMTDFVNTRQFLEALWDVEARMRSLRISDFMRFQQLFNQVSIEMDRNDASSHTEDIKSGIQASKIDTLADEPHSMIPGVELSGQSVTKSHYAPSVASSGVFSMTNSLASTDCTNTEAQPHADRQKVCSSCGLNTATIIVMPCNHLILCHECLKREQPNRCPSCRKPVQQTMRIFM